MLVEGASVAPSVPVQTIGTATRPAAADAARNPTNIFGGCLQCVTHERPPLNRFRLGSPHIEPEGKYEESSSANDPHYFQGLPDHIVSLLMRRSSVASPGSFTAGRRDPAVAAQMARLTEPSLSKPFATGAAPTACLNVEVIGRRGRNTFGDHLLPCLSKASVIFFPELVGEQRARLSVICLRRSTNCSRSSLSINRTVPA